MQDNTLLTQYARTGSDTAFSQLIARHLPLVYRTCRRELASDTLAEDAAQVVFLLLARKAKTLRTGPSLAGWLYQTSVFVAKDVRKQEARRLRREEAVMQEAIHQQATPTPEWDTVEPLLNAALSSLKPADREAVLLRYFESHTLAEIGTLLGLSEDAARMRCARAVDKLRVYLTAHGAAVTGVVLAALLTTEAARPLPADATATVTQGTLQALTHSPTANVLLLSKGVSHTMKVIKLKVAALVATTLFIGASVPPLAHAFILHKPSVQSSFTAPAVQTEAPALTAGTQTAPAAQAIGTQTIVLQHTVAGQMVQFLHWDQSAKLPAGVTKVEAVPAQNALAVTATPAGLTKVREILKPLDVEPRQVLIKSGFARVSDAQLKASGINSTVAPPNKTFLKPMLVFYTSSPLTIQLLQTQAKPGTIIQAPDITTTNNVTANIQISTTLPSGKELQQIAVTPHLNGDGTITLVLHPVFAEGDVKHEVTATRIIKNGSTEIIAMPLVAPEAAGENMLFFVTPTFK